MRSPNAVLNNTGIALLALAFPIAALANVTGTPTLSANTALNLDTGTTSASGGDILWSGSTITPQGKATAVSLVSYGLTGATSFAALSQTVLSALSSLYSAAPLTASSLAVNDIVAVKTNGGNYAAVMVTAASGTSITLQFVTYVTVVPTGPVITAVQNNYSNIQAGFVNSGIAQGALFYVIGTGLANPSAQAVLQSSTAAGGLPTTLNGASVKVTSGGVTVTPVFYYAVATALGLVLPSNTPVGTATITVTYNGNTSAAFSFQVVQTAMGFDTYYGSGSGLGVAVFVNAPPAGSGCAQSYISCYTNSIPPGTTIELYGSGLGADPARDTQYVTPTGANINGLAHIYVGGIDAQILYQGASGFPGLNQVNLIIPQNVQPGCNVSVVGVTATGVPTNPTTLAIGNGVCSDTAFGVNGTQLAASAGSTTTTNSFGEVFIVQSTSPASSGPGTTLTDGATAIFETSTVTTSGSSSGGGGEVSIPGCIFYEYVSTTSTSTTTGLDAGTITVTGPAGSVTLTEETINGTLYPGFYFDDSLPTGFLPAAGGTFTFKGSGGANVGPFTASVVFPNPVLTWTNQSAAANPAIITRSAGLPITWAGGAAGTYVYMTGSSSSSSGSLSGSFTCIAPVALGQFTVPAYILAVLPAGTGNVSVGNETALTTFTATGINSGIALGEVSYDVNSTYK